MPNYGAYPFHDNLAQATHHGFAPMHLGFNGGPQAVRQEVHNHERQEFNYLLHLTTDGCGHFVDEEFQQEHSLPLGTAFLVPTPSATSYWASAARWEMLWVFFNGTAACSFAAALIQQHQSHVFPNLDKTPSMPALLRMLALQETGGMHRARAAGLLCEILHGLLDYQEDQLPSSIETARQFMQQHFSDPNLSIDTVAAHADLSRAHFTRFFRKHMHCSPLAYLTKLRLERAIDHITGSRHSIARIAQLVGFHEAAYFNNVFKKHFGYSPGKLRAPQSFCLVLF